MKTVRNEKEWTEYGWLYRMTRIVNGKKCLAYHVAFSKHEMHSRAYVAWKLRAARKALACAVVEEKNLLEFT